MRAIAAMSANRVIGYKGEIPWHISDDMKWFKKMTTDPEIGGYLIMGLTTFQKVGVLPNRFTYILTNNPNLRALQPSENWRYVSPDDLRHLTLPWARMWVVGGAKTYTTMLPQCKELYVTNVLGDYVGDTYMPEFEHLFPMSETIREEKEFWITRYWK